jgi:hypothetical protein
MTNNEAQTILDGYVKQSFANEATRKVYRATIHRLLQRVPVEAWGDVPTMRLYRSTLSAAGRTKFGAVWQHVAARMESEGVAVVSAEQITRFVRTPFPMADAIEWLSLHTTFSRLSTWCWGDVSMTESGGSIEKIVPIDERIEGMLTRIIEYVWPNEKPPDDAPIIPLSRLFRTAPMPPDMLEGIIESTVTGNGESALERAAIETVEAMVGAGMPYRAVEDRMADLAHLDEKANKRDRKRIETLVDRGTEVLRGGNRVEFNLLWATMLARVDSVGKPMDSEYERRWFSDDEPVAAPVRSIETEFRGTLKNTNAWLKNIVKSS